MIKGSRTQPGGPLGGLLVIDLANGAAGPFGATMLADFGVEVVKVEWPGAGDPIRQWDSAGGMWWRSMFPAAGLPVPSFSDGAGCITGPWLHSWNALMIYKEKTARRPHEI